ncbi:SCO family protein [Thiohalobacter thiocyanaticus]|uniref:SCO family protein n=1 Tax=Thiohalobacter thiocyanaticus TaxID=585455 RepID=A0A426QKZ0_9GAMM|nr:SCO family protein [Thiohalobacter thiocyanaticus]RRQ22399.1 SCO family protein [Thiohalobacter thiocyanaticus]
MRCGLLTVLAVTVLGLATLAWGTDGFRAFTDEGARRHAVHTNPRPLPAVTLQDQTGRRFGLDDLRGRLVAVEFIYVNCPSVCRALGQAFARVRDALPAESLGQDVVLLSISFDPQRDRPERLADYAARYGADTGSWRVARVEDPAELQALLRSFGIVVIPNGFGGFEHNAALHLVDRRGRLARIEDFDRPLAFVERVREWL